MVPGESLIVPPHADGCAEMLSRFEFTITSRAQSGRTEWGVTGTSGPGLDPQHSAREIEVATLENGGRRYR